ncbi:hypothetical protein [Nocardiopsis sp. FR26]|uniref:hypothetical protein n=1 Tax=Nocardiopsis sp. FR26 TaxID=2605987 RepID=UPI00135689C6|nr:hypothetical protein [Nocardiopsis sp. FR26]
MRRFSITGRLRLEVGASIRRALTEEAERVHADVQRQLPTRHGVLTRSAAQAFAHGGILPDSVVAPVRHPAARPMRRSLAECEVPAVDPGCAHAEAIPVETIGSVLDPPELVAWLCPDCDIQLPPEGITPHV